MAFTSSILVPTDFSRKSEIAIRHACEIAVCTGAEILFLNVIEPPYDFPSRIDDLLESKKNEAAKQLGFLIDDLHSVDTFRFIKMKGKVEVGKVGTVILEAVRNGKHDLIAVGLGGDHDLKKTLYGSITNNLLLESPVPVFAISKRIDYRRPRQLIFATDLRDHDIKPIKKMSSFARDLGASFRIVHILENTNQNKDHINAFTSKIQSKLEEQAIEIDLYEASNFLEGITEFIGGDKQTILVTTRYKKSFLEWLIAKSTARVLAQIAAVPLLLIPSE